MQSVPITFINVTEMSEAAKLRREYERTASKSRKTQVQETKVTGQGPAVHENTDMVSILKQNRAKVCREYERIAIEFNKNNNGKNTQEELDAAVGLLMLRHQPSAQVHAGNAVAAGSGSTEDNVVVYKNRDTDSMLKLMKPGTTSSFGSELTASKSRKTQVRKTKVTGQGPAVHEDTDMDPVLKQKRANVCREYERIASKTRKTQVQKIMVIRQGPAVNEDTDLDSFFKFLKRNPDNKLDNANSPTDTHFQDLN